MVNVQAISENGFGSQLNSDQPKPVGKINGRTVVQVDSSYLQRKDLTAGAGPGMFDGLFQGIFIASFIGAIALASLAFFLGRASR